MKRYVKNVLYYVVAFLGLLAFLGLFATPLSIYDELRGVWVKYQVNAYLGHSVGKTIAYKGAGLPIIGFVLPLFIGIFLVIESFKPAWRKKISILNTIFSIILFFSSIAVLLTKEIFLEVNNLGPTVLINNGVGPIFAANCNLIGGIILLFATWWPTMDNMEFIEE